LDVLNELAVVAADEQALPVWEKCEVSRFALFDAEAVKVADSMGLMLALLTADELTRNKSLREDEAFAISQMIATPKAVIYPTPEEEL